MRDKFHNKFLYVTAWYVLQQRLLRGVFHIEISVFELISYVFFSLNQLDFRTTKESSQPREWS